MQEQPPPPGTPLPAGESQNNYTTSINELISEPNRPSSTEYFLSTLFELSLYLFRKKTQPTGAHSEISFDEYLSSVSK